MFFVQKNIYADISLVLFPHAEERRGYNIKEIGEILEKRLSGSRLVAPVNKKPLTSIILATLTGHFFPNLESPSCRFFLFIIIIFSRTTHTALFSFIYCHTRRVLAAATSLSIFVSRSFPNWRLHSKIAGGIHEASQLILVWFCAETRSIPLHQVNGEL